MTVGVEIVRDVDGIAHVRAPDLEGVFFGQGYAAAEDRLWQLEYDRRRASGTLAEVAGAGAVGSDVLHRRLGLAAAARADYGALTADGRAALDAYAAGVNARLDRLRPADLPPELAALAILPEPWQPWESIAVFKVRHLLMGTYEGKIWRSALVRNLGAEAVAQLWPTEAEVTVVPGDAVRVARDLASDLRAVTDALGSIPDGAAASNSVAVHGARTATGLPLVAGDPHRAFDLPNVYWQNHVTCPELDVIGLSFPGVPGFPHFGHNPDVAWCITHGMADDQDVFLERLRAVGDGCVEYELEGSWLEADVHDEVVQVHGGDPARIAVIATHHGPVVAGGTDVGVGLALRWTALADRDSSFDALIPMMRARTVAELDEAMRPWVAPVNNVVFADRAGDIAFRLRGRLPFRPSSNGWTVVPGWSGEHEWVGWCDYDEMPKMLNPAQGFLVTANNRQGTGGPYVSNDFAHSARAQRLTELVGARQGWSAPELAEVLCDTESLVAPRFVGPLLAVPARHPVERAAQRALADWDLRMDVDSAGAAVYAACRVELLRVVAAALGLADDRLGALGAGPTLHQTSRFLWTRLAHLAGAADDRLLTGVGGWDGAYSSALRWGVRDLEARFGADVSRWRWGTLHLVRWVHPMASLRPDLAASFALPATVEVAGDADCLRASGIAPPGLDAVTGSVARYVFDLDDWDRSAWVVPHGVSGDPTSTHWTDQLERWAAGRMSPMRFTRAAVDAATESTIRLDPSVR